MTVAAIKGHHLDFRFVCAVAAAAVFYVVPTVTSAQEPPAAAVVAERFLNALAEERWQEAAALVHPETAEYLRGRLLARLECPQDQRLPTLDEFWRADPKMSREVAEYMYRRQYRATLESEKSQTISGQFPGTENLEQLRSLPNVEFFARYLAGQRRLGRGDGPPAFYHVHVVGQAVENGWVNVLYRYNYERDEEDPSGVIGLYRPPPRIIRLRLDSGRAWIASGFPHTGVAYFGPGTLPRVEGRPCPGDPTNR